jgi:hypothetical protein
VIPSMVMGALACPPGAGPDDRTYAEIDRKTKAEAIKQARAALIGIEKMIEDAVNDEPPRFMPNEAWEIRTTFAVLADRVEDALILLGQERDEFAELNLVVGISKQELATARKQRDEGVEKITFWFNEVLRLKRLLDDNDIGYETEPDCKE